jgi:cellulose 1,4-beta-cellobiosidase
MPGSPSPPGGLSASPGNLEVALSWTASSGASSYNVKRALVSGGPYTTIANTTATLYMNAGLAGGTYYYVVSAVNSVGESANTAEASAAVNCPVTVVPTGLNATTQNGQMLLAWTPVTTGTSPTTYNVLRSTNSNGPFALLATGLVATNYCDSTALSNVTYYYLVQAFNACGQSPTSSAIGITPLSPPSLGASFSGNQLMVLSWPTWIGDYALYTTTNIALPASWQPMTNLPLTSNDMLSVSLQVTNTTQQFFRLISQ